MNKNSLIGIIAVVAIALMAGIWIGSEKDIISMELDEITKSATETKMMKDVNSTDLDAMAKDIDINVDLGDLDNL